MRQRKQLYEKSAAGRRIRRRRETLGITRHEIAQKYYADIERGYCGMSLDIMINIADCLGITLDYLVFGEAAEKGGAVSEETKSILFYLENCNEEKQKKAMELLKVYLAE